MLHCLHLSNETTAQVSAEREMDRSVVSIRVKCYSSEADVFHRPILCDFLPHISSHTCFSVAPKTVVKFIILHLSLGKSVKHLNLFIYLFLAQL